MNDDPFREARWRMVAEQIEARGVRDPRVLAAMREVPRDRFVPAALARHAHDDGALPIEEGQTISQPLIVAEMAAAADPPPDGRVLEVGAGSGYAAAVLSRLAGRVFAIERWPALADAARERLASLGYANVEVGTGDGSLGWPEAAPFDAIIVSAAAPRIPPALLDQLAPEGRLIAPIGPPGRQRLVKITRADDGGWCEAELGAVAFVPLVSGVGR